MDDAEAGPLLTSEDEGNENSESRRNVRKSTKFSTRTPLSIHSFGCPAWITLNRNLRCVVIFLLVITGYAIVHNVIVSSSGDLRGPEVRFPSTQATLKSSAGAANEPKVSQAPNEAVVRSQVDSNEIMPYDFTLPDFSPQWYSEACFGDSKKGISIDEIYAKLEVLKDASLAECKTVRTIFDRIFRMDKIDAPIVLPEEFKSEVKGWLGNDSILFDQVSHQKVFKVVNKYSFEETVFNPLRSKRPTSKSTVDPLIYIANLTESTKPTCDFCSFEKHTAADSFGRIINKYTATASNTFKLAKFHGLFFPKTHHPINISREAVTELFVETSQQWFTKAHEADSSQRYPSLLWDTLPHAGASQVHPHIHGVLDSHQYTGYFEAFHDMSQLYFRDYGSSFWSDIVLVHWALGLGTVVGDGKSVIFVPLFARKDHEFMIVSSKVNADFSTSINAVLNAYKKSLKVYCFSAGGTYPFMGSYIKNLDRYEHPGLPALFRFGSRGSCTSIGSDVSSLELYSINNINSNISTTFQAVLDSSSQE